MAAVEYLILLAPIAIEIAVDIWLFSKGKTDKPLTTIARVPAFILFGIINDWAGFNTWWQSSIYILFLHILIFDYALNLVRGKHFFYHPPISNIWDEFMYKIDGFYGLLLRVFVWFWGWGLYYHIDKI